MKIEINIFLVFVLFAALGCSQQKNLGKNSNLIDLEKHASEVMKFQDELTDQYLDPEDSPLGASNIESFKESGGHKFFPIDSKYKVVATLDTTNFKKDIGFETSTERIAMYDKIGVAEFEIDSVKYALSIFESHYYREHEAFNDDLFLPYTDLTNSETTYGGGRYIDLKRSGTDQIIIDFNKSYNPYCAYSTNYSCPVPPRENFLEVKVEAGIKLLQNDQ